MTAPLLLALLVTQAPPAERDAAPAPATTGDLVDVDARVDVDDPEGTAPTGSAMSADERESRARTLYAAGSGAYAKGRYIVAIEAFEEALRLVDRTPVFFSCAQAHRLQYFIDSDIGHLERAVALYREYMKRAPDGTRRDHAGQHLSVLGPLLEQLRLSEVSADGNTTPAPARLIVSSSAAGALARLDDGEPQTTPATFSTTPGRHAVLVEAPGFVTRREDAVAVEGAAVAVTLNLSPTPATLDVRAPDGASVFLDGKRSAAGSQEVAPGPHRVTVLAHGREPFVANIAPAPGEAASVEAELPVTLQSWLGVLALAGSGALVAASIIPGAGLGASLFVIGTFQQRGQTRGYLLDTEANAHNGVLATLPAWSAAGGALLLGAAVSAAVGTSLLLLDEPEPPPPPLPAPRTVDRAPDEAAPF